MAGASAWFTWGLNIGRELTFWESGCNTGLFAPPP